MCGIVGIFNLNEKPVASNVIKNMAEALAHRGPDGEGYFVRNNVGLGHKRLAIIDPSPRSAQPMSSSCGKWVVSFNGCIYNFMELKLELQRLGRSFVTTSDTEVLVEGLAVFGEAFLERLNGMFAVAAWNKEQEYLILSRDRFGVKPLYYWFNGRSIVFASEIKAIMKHPDYEVQVDNDALNEYFTFQNLFRYRTLFKDVVMLPPANTIRIQKGTKEVVTNSWWDYDFTQPDEKMSFEDGVEETARLFQQAVVRQLVSDVPVGSFLSGGMDSGSIVAIASKHIPRLSTFTAGFELSGVSGIESSFDERMDAELMANHFKTEHFEQVINSGDLKWSLPRVVWHIEDLRVGMSYPNYYISRLASKFVKVCLQGTGGDELYGGYPWRYYRIFRSLDQAAFFDNYYDFWQRLVPEKDKQRLFTDDVYRGVSHGAPRRIFERVFTFNDKLKYDTPEQHIQNSLYFEIKTFLHGLLIVGDKLSMANGLEERFPFLDNDLVNFAQKIPVRHKLGNLEKMKRFDENEYQKKRRAFQQFDDGKNVLRKSMKQFLPEKIINRKKQGFSAPDESWYRKDNGKYIKELLLDKNAASRGLINHKYVKQILDEHNHKGMNHRLMIWSFLNFEWWCKLFLEGQKIEDI